MLLTDGTVLIQECQLGQATRRWWRLHPDQNGSYFNGLWSRAADFHVARLYFPRRCSRWARDCRRRQHSDASGFNTEDETNRCEITTRSRTPDRDRSPGQFRRRDVERDRRRRQLGARRRDVPPGKRPRQPDRDLRSDRPTPGRRAATRTSARRRRAGSCSLTGRCSPPTASDIPGPKSTCRPPRRG